MNTHPSDKLALLFYRVNRSLQYFMSLHFKEFDITPEQWNVLKLLQDKNGISQTDLSFKADKDKTTITRILVSLERRGCIRKEINPHDRRSFKVYLSKEGHELIQTLQHIPDRVNRNVSSDFTEDELTSFKRMLSTLEKRIEVEIDRYLQGK